MALSELTRFSIPTEVVYGINALELLGVEAKRLGAIRALVVTDKGVKDSGVLDRALLSLKNSDIPCAVFHQTPQDPDSQLVDSLVGLIKKEDGCNCVVGLGGGSVLCAAKAAALVATNGGNIRDYAGVERYQRPPLTCIAVTTTAGSGAEVSKVTVMTDDLSKHKMGIIGFTNAPRLAILDPLLLVSLPKSQAVASGADAFTHAIEAYLSARATPLTDTIALKAIEIISANFCPSVLTDDLEAKSNMLFASTIANMACGNAGLGLSHALEPAITYMCNIRGYEPFSYGMIHAICLPHVLKFNLPARESKFASMADAMGLSWSGASIGELGKAAIERVKDILIALDAPKKLPWKEVPPEDLEGMVNAVLEHGKAHPNPRKYNREDLITLFENIIQGWDKD
jgi:alcohol dehydrogenase class IV